MHLLITRHELDHYKSRDKIPLLCLHCNETFYLAKNAVQRLLKSAPHRGRYCSLSCKGKSESKLVYLMCPECGKSFSRKASEVTGRNCCSRSCAVKRNNREKKSGTNRSRAEKFLFELIRKKFHGINAQSGVRNVLQSGLEIDIFLPDIQLAIEVNGPIHYKPIFGEERLAEVQHNDKMKSAECEQNKIHLIVVDISEFRCWKKSEQFLAQFFESEIVPLIREQMT